MEKHHEESIARVTDHFQKDPDVEALILGGSLAHGYEKPDSDIDIMIIVSDDRYEKQLANGGVHYLNADLCNYPGGYVDGKYLAKGFLKKVAEMGSEPARFAFDGSKILFSRNREVEDTIRMISRYPVEGKQERIRRFHAQFFAWFWFVTEAVKKNNRYLMGMAVAKMVLFGGRLILTHNEMLYPYHKWFLRRLEAAPDKPEGMMECIDRLYSDTTLENAQRLFELVKDFREWVEPGASWPSQFVADSEWNWMGGATPVDDL